MMGFLIKTEALPVGTRVRVYDAVTRGSILGTVIRGSAKRISVRLDEDPTGTRMALETSAAAAMGFMPPASAPLVWIFTLRASGRWIRRYQPDAWDSLRVWRAITLEEED